MCGAFVRRWWLPGDIAGSNAGDNARRNASENASGNARARRWSLQAAPVVTPGRAARSGAFAVSLLLCLCAGLASLNAARRPGLINAPERPLSDAGALHGPSTSAATMPAVLAHSTAPRLSGVRACSSVKRGDCRDLPESAWIRLNTPDLAQCPSAPGLGTVGGMMHTTRTTRQRTRRAPALPRWAARTRTCPAVAKPAQECPTRPVALTVRGGTRDNAARAVRDDGGPRSWGRAVVNGTRSASSLRAPGVRAARLQGFTASGLSRHGGARPGDMRAASHRQQSGEFQP
jgi:hypothetical protein